jgi:hypothetical protein
MNNLELVYLVKYLHENENISLDEFTDYISSFDNMCDISTHHISLLYGLKNLIKHVLCREMNIWRDPEDPKNIIFGYRESYFHMSLLELLDISLNQNIANQEDCNIHKNMYEVMVKYFDVNIQIHTVKIIKEHGHSLEVKKHILKICMDNGLDIYEIDNNNKKILDYVIDTPFYDYLINLHENHHMIKEPGYD